MKSAVGGISVAYRLAVTSRVLAAVFGGYLLASMASACLALLLPMTRGDAVVSALLLAFVVYLLAALWCFACRSAWRAWLGVLLPSLLLALVSALAKRMAQP